MRLARWCIPGATRALRPASGVSLRSSEAGSQSSVRLKLTCPANDAPSLRRASSHPDLGTSTPACRSLSAQDAPEGGPGRNAKLFLSRCLRGHLSK